MLSAETRQLYRLFADTLDYPGAGTAAMLIAGQAQLAESCPEAAAHLRSFAAFVEEQELHGLQEIYTRTFDITPTTNLYVGFHLFGESYKRGAFMARIEEAFAQHRFDRGAELADHLCVLLRFASVCDDAEFVLPLLEEAMLPALGKIESAFQDSSDGYALAVRSLVALLEAQFGSLASRLPDYMAIPSASELSDMCQPAPHGWPQPLCGGPTMAGCAGSAGRAPSRATAFDPQPASLDPRLYPGGMEHD